MIDLHVHILPGLDDGPADLDGAVALARVAVANGTRVLAATSHIDTAYSLVPDDLAAARALVANRLAAEAIPLEVVQGGEVSPIRFPNLRDEDLRSLALGAGRWILLECPFSPAASAMEPMIADLHRRGFRVLLAHPERSPTFQREPARLARLIELGALAQLTSGSLAGDFGSVPRRIAFDLLERGLCHVLASDAHDARQRPPVLSTAIAVVERRFIDGAAQVAWMTEAVPAAIIADARLPERPAPLRRRRLARLRDALGA